MATLLLILSHMWPVMQDLTAICAVLAGLTATALVAAQRLAGEPVKAPDDRRRRRRRG